MKLNENQAVLAPNVLLVPYSEHHVPTYHEWMQDEELQKATASEPLTLPQEYDMQKSWRNDTDKLTFIALTAPPQSTYTSSGFNASIQSNFRAVNPSSSTPPFSMIGDVNLFLYPDSDSDNQDEDDPPDPSNQKEQEQEQQVVGEVEIMIAKKSEQGKGMGKKILLTFLWFIVSSLEGVMGEYHATHGDGKTGSSLKYLRVKIDHENTRSIRLFSSVGFQKVSESPNYFGELELRLPICAGLKEEVEGRMDAIPFIVGYS